jgi:exopolyphosphatase/guanosine-5'-triphosphate,3'-diphosphate pyrophosphatase
VLCACIDIGSNTTRLLVADAAADGLRVVHEERAFTRLGSSGEISALKVEEVAATVAAQVSLARSLGAERIRAVATAALRAAGNREIVVAAIERESGVLVDVLSGVEEAGLAFLGATRTLGHVPLGEVGVVDVGGGSTEIVCGTVARGVTWSASLSVGSGFLAEHYLRSDPPAAAELRAVREHVAGVLEGLEPPQPRIAYAVGGSATSLGRLVGGVLDAGALGEALRILASLPVAEVADRYGLDARRVRLLPAGIVLLDEAVAALGAPLQVSSGGIREGVILEQLTVEELTG